MNDRIQLKWAISFHKYPRYITDIWVQLVLQRLWRMRGISLGNGIVWHGKPIVSIAQGSALVIGDRCLICSRSDQTALGVNHAVILRTLWAGAELRIGAGVRMSGTTICAAERIVIGDRCVIGSNVTIVDTDFHALDPLARSSPEDARLSARRPVEIGDDVFLGSGSIILKGVFIGSCAIIGAGSVVTKNVAQGAIVAGNPARQVGHVREQVDANLSSHKLAVGGGTWH